MLLNTLDAMTENHVYQQSGGDSTASHDNLSKAKDHAAKQLDPERLRWPQIAGEGSSLNRPGAEQPNASSRAGSLNTIGELSSVVNLAQGGGASGLVGHMSEVAWIDQAFAVVRGRPDATRPRLLTSGVLDPHVFSATNFIYFVDDNEVLAVNEDRIDPYQRPSFSRSLILTEAYFHALQGAFPFVVRDEFLANLFDMSTPQHSWRGRRQLAKANMIWAIGSKWLEMTGMNGEALSPTDTHPHYYARARALGLDHRVVFDHPNIDQVQAMGLLALYLLFNGSVTRAWNTLGCAIRHATALGLHLQVTDPSVSNEDLRRRARTWYSLYSLEVLISEITGRPKSISVSDVTAPIDLLAGPASGSTRSTSLDDSTRSVPPVPISTTQVGEPILLEISRKAWLEHLKLMQNNNTATSSSSSSSLSPGLTIGDDDDHAIPTTYLPQRLHLCLLSDKIARQLYSGTNDPSWLGLQRRIHDLEAELRRWVETLPENLSPASSPAGRGDEFLNPRIRIELAMYYHSLQMILYRPCLCANSAEAEAVESREFNHRAARACVLGALSMLALLPDVPTIKEIYRLLPWWSLLHFVAQASAVLHLELAIDAQHFEGEVDKLVESVAKAMRYLHCMAGASLSAYRAWKIFRVLLNEVSRRYHNMDLNDFAQDAPRPHGWTEEVEKVMCVWPTD
ncbi:hypothetical protein PV08_04223 [Exophiala spinifera]|uniref:Xylanolytic transcriptional activator regulatory domain-containing protein n=1 Tax=Exophiala spinifera TaxID=91928 RepID=A0A0D1ZWJ1_9EURO|nr:uncharacterized protein PV08_04223 [Exophiala spinifera]KIW17032.1 hypothetical protein PV08_04223 [Exophiala spinifera]